MPPLPVLDGPSLAPASGGDPKQLIILLHGYGSNGNDLLLGSAGSDVLFGGAGTDTFSFTKFSGAGDTDYVIDWELGRDLLSFGEGVTIAAAQVTDAGTAFNGVGLANDPSTPARAR